MSKKLLSLFVVLCMVLGMAPAVLAAGLEDYTDAEIAMYVDKDATLTETVDGLVVVTAPVKVILNGAKLTAGIAILEEAKGAEVTISEKAEVNAVVVLAEATVVIEETATVTAVSVAAPATDVEVAGTVENITVETAAEGAKVAVKETATVATVAVAAPKADVEVAGKVKSVQVKEAAAGAKVAVKETATVTTVEVAAPDTTVDVAGAVESVEVAETATGAELVVEESAKIEGVTDATGGLEVSGDGAGNVTVEEKKEETPTPAPAPSTPSLDDDEEERQPGQSGGSDAEEDAITWGSLGIEAAPIAARDSSGELIGDDSAGTFGNSDIEPVGDDRVKLKTGNVKEHYGEEGLSGGSKRWVGLAIPTTSDTYQFYVIIKNNSTNKYTVKAAESTEYFDPDTKEKTYYIGVITEASGKGSPIGEKDSIEDLFDALFQLVFEPEDPDPHSDETPEIETNEAAPVTMEGLSEEPVISLENVEIPEAAKAAMKKAAAKSAASDGVTEEEVIVEEEEVVGEEEILDEEEVVEEEEIVEEEEVIEEEVVEEEVVEEEVVEEETIEEDA